MARQQLTAEMRTILGRQVSSLRRAGKLPGVVYGPVLQETVQVSVDHRSFERFYQKNGHSTLFDLSWDGGMRPVFIRDVQRDPVRQTLLHVDFYAPNLRKAITAMVPLVFHNPDLHAEGVLTELATELELEAEPETLPHQINIDISRLIGPGDSIRIADLELGEGVTATGDPETILVMMSESRAEVVEDGEDSSAEATAEPAPAE